MGDHIEPQHQDENNEEPTQKEDHFDSIIPEEVQEILTGLPEPQKKAVEAILLGISYQRIWQGPYPPPEILKAYNDAFPNGAENIFLESKAQREHRHALENKVIPEELSQSRRGQTFGFIITLAFLVASFVLILKGHGVYGTILGGVDLITLVTIFVYGRKTQVNRLSGKDKKS